jgi:hypothetical protein
MNEGGRQPVTKRTRPDLDWTGREKGFWVFDELLQSDAYRTRTKTESDIILFILSRRKFPRKRAKKTPLDFWSPLNGQDMNIPHVTITEFFSKGSEPPPLPSTISRAINSLMHCGFLEPLTIGGRGKGDMSVYRLTHDWRVWRKGDPPVYTKTGMSNVKGFCIPGSGTFCPARKLEKRCELA